MTESTTETPLSVIICTHNRSEYATECVQAISRCDGSNEIDVIVVDNASTSEHRERLAASVAQSNVRLVDEEKPGVSNARNRGVALARSPWLAYLDDDALPFSDWVTSALKLVASVDSRVGLIGGAVFPRWPSSLPDGGIEPERLGSRWRSLLSIVENERVARGSTVPDFVACNMLIRRSLLEDLGQFSPDLGRTPNRLLGGEEIEVARKVVARGYTVQFEPSLRVYHQIHAERLAPEWIRKRAEAEGELLWRSSPSPAIAAKVVLSIPYLALASRLRALPSGAPSDYDHHVRLWNNLGFVKSAISSVTARPNAP